MFWKFDLHTTSHIDQLLDREDVTLRELMDEDDVLQECKAQNRRLLLFLSQDHCMQELVSLITVEPSADLEEKSRFKYPNIACELLTSDVTLINDKLGGDEALLETLYGFLEQAPPLNPLLASFFSKTIGNLIARKTEQVISFLRKKEGFIGLVLSHIDASAMMDLLLRLISCVEPAPLRQEVLDWLNEERLIQRLSHLLHTGADEERQSNASQTLCDIIRLSRDQANQMQEPVESDPLLAVLEAQETVAELLKNMFDGEKTEATVVNGTQVLLTLLETRRPGLEGLMDLYSQGYERSYTVSSSILNAIEPHLKDFQQLLLDPPKKEPMVTSVGVLEEPLGNGRLHVVRLVAALLQTAAPNVCLELGRLATMDLLLDLFFKYTWNNFLHFQVELCVAAILNHSAHEEGPAAGLQNHREGSTSLEEEVGEPDEEQRSSHADLVAHLFQKCRLVQRILEAWEENDRIQADGGARRGNMGHLTRIANMVVQNLEKGAVQAQISDLIKELPEDCKGRWESFVDETLRETNRKNTVELVSTHNLHSSSEDDDMENPFPNDLSLQQAFSDYQIQQMAPNFVDQFGFNDEEFNEHEDNINASFDRIAEISFNIDADDNSANAAAFEACCKERIRQFDDAEEEEDIWEDKEINYATQVKARTRFGGSHTSKTSVANGRQDRDRGSGSDDDEQQSGEDIMATDPEAEPRRERPSEESKATPPTETPSWTASFGEAGGNSSSPAPVSWDSPSQGEGDGPGTGWATFTQFQPYSGSEPGSQARESLGAGASPKQTQDKPLASSSPVAWEESGPRKASDSSSSGGSDSEEDVDKKPTRGITTELKEEEIPVNLAALSITDDSPEVTSSQSAEAAIATTTDRKVEPPSSPEITVNGPV